MQSLSPTYLAEIARQIGFISAFLGGVAATLMTAVLGAKDSRAGSLTVVVAASAAVAFIVAVVASTLLTMVVHPDAPANVVAGVNLVRARILAFLPFVAGMYLLLGATASAGWLHSRRTGRGTTVAALAGAVLITYLIVG